MENLYDEDVETSGEQSSEEGKLLCFNLHLCPYFTKHYRREMGMNNMRFLLIRPAVASFLALFSCRRVSADDHILNDCRVATIHSSECAFSFYLHYIVDICGISFVVIGWLCRREGGSGDVRFSRSQRKGAVVPQG